jgi:hypothetical protein
VKKPARLARPQARGRRRPRRARPALNAAALAYLGKHVTMDKLLTVLLGHFRTKNGDIILDIARDLGGGDRLLVNIVERPSPYRRGKQPGLVAWHAGVEAVFQQNPALTLHALLQELSAQVRAQMENGITEVVGPDRARCMAECPPDYHFHILDAQDRRRPLSRGTVANFLSRLRQRQRPPASA